MTLDRDTAARYLEVGLDHIEREYPNHPGHLLTGPDDLQPPSTLHPVFFGSYDWHSAVHMHWMLLRVLARHPQLPQADAVLASFARRLTPDDVEAEVTYLDAHPWFERPYGWAWLLMLQAELAADRIAGQHTGELAAIMAPLAARIRTLSLRWLAEVPHPQRSGTHANSAFAAGLILDVARAHRDRQLEEAVDTAATRWFGGDERAAPWLEPSSTDFLSPTLTVADLQRRRLDRDAFTAWFARYAPELEPLLQPVEVTDREDPQLVHLDGLNLSRAWHWARIREALDPGHPAHGHADRAATAHAAEALPAVLHGSYVGSHWLPTFAVAALDALDGASGAAGATP
ncbi:MAG: DUF2891 domain-containing protein [Nitriliruptoraceae bacterium]|nr:DUF2891 domain-containing protein [Nitriliruptoraceae bacterium]